MFHDFGTAFCREQLGFQSEAETGYRNLLEGFPALQGGEYLKQRILFPAYRALAQLLWSIGSTGESILVLERASEDPDVPAGILRHLGDRYQELGLVDSADGAYERAAHSGRFEDLYDEARTIVRWIRSRADNPSGSTLASADLSPLWDFQRRVDPGDDPGTLLALARALALGQQNRKSLHWLEMAVRAGYRNADILRRDPDFASIRERKKFNRILAQIEQES
jgi:tetratricopeptide (TPR) repeat protein